MTQENDMSLYQKIKDDLVEYRKNHAKDQTKLLQTLVGELNTKEKSNVKIDDSYVAKLIKVFVNNINETLKHATSQDTIDKLKAEAELLNSYLPKLLSEDEVKRIIADNALTDVPTGMKYFKEHYNGLYDGKMVSVLLK